MNVPEGHGLECWRRFSRNSELRTRKQGQKRLLHLMEPHVTGDFYADLDVWEREVADYERLHSKTLDPDLRLAVLSAKLAPSEL